MNKQIAPWQLIHKSLLEQVPVMLLYVLESSGSSPGRQGFFMAVNKNGELEGSIGGGIMEHKFVEMARDMLSQAVDSSLAPLIRKQVHNKSAAKNQSGMICSGEQLNFFYRVREEDLLKVERIIYYIHENKKAWLILSPQGISLSEHEQIENNFQFELKSEQEWVYKERIGYKNQLYIIGGGHCALALSKIMCMMDYNISIYDTRPGLHTMQLNNYVHEKHILNDYQELEALIPQGSENFIVVMTFGYRSDDIAVSALLRKQFRYLGLLGSRNKIKKLLGDLREKGFTEQQLSRIHAPAGLPVNSQTPEEIAISIAAQIIALKNS